MSTPPAFHLRTELRAGDVGRIVERHGVLYAREYGFDATFEAYVAGPLAEFVLRQSPRERIWIAERRETFAGCVAIVGTTESTVAQLRWFVVEPEARGIGIGSRLLDDAIAFAREASYERVILWTVAALTAAARRYHAFGFRKVEEHAAKRWGVEVLEERYERYLRSG